MTTIDKLGDDLLVEILIRSFPNPKPAFRSKLVCKRWRSLISDPVIFNRRFVSHHKSINDKLKPPLLVTPSPSLFRHHRLSFLPVPDEVGPYFTVWDSFKDLLLCGFSDVGVYKGKGLGRFYFLCNPFTEQWIALPLAPKRPRGILRYAARLVYEPVNSLDLGDGGAEAFEHSSYRFRVVFMYHTTKYDVRLDVFCFESGEWIKDALVLQDSCFERVVSCSGKFVFRAYRDTRPGPNDGFEPLVLRALDPFRLDVHPSLVCTSIALSRHAKYHTSVLQGVLHMVVVESERDECCSRNALSVWRLEEGGESWRKLHEEVLLKKTTMLSGCSYELDRLFSAHLHPQRPEIVFLNYDDACGKKVVVLSMDLTGRGEVEFVGVHSPYWKAFQPKVSCWPTPIPKYEELRGTYHESCNHLLKIKKSTNIPPWLER